MRFLGRSLPVGDFRPWGRLLVLLGGILVFGSAARKLARHVRDAQVRERMEAVADAEERLAARTRPLVALDGLPHAALRSPGAALGSTAARTHLWLDGGDGPGANASVLVVTDGGAETEPHDGATTGLRVLPPRGLQGALALEVHREGTADGIALLRVESLHPTLPGAARWAGRLVPPPLVAVEVEADADAIVVVPVLSDESPADPIARARLARALERTAGGVFAGLLPEGLLEFELRNGPRRALLRRWVRAGDAPHFALGPGTVAPADLAPAPAPADAPAPGDAFVFEAGPEAASGPSLFGWELRGVPGSPMRPSRRPGAPLRALVVETPFSSASQVHLGEPGDGAVDREPAWAPMTSGLRGTLRSESGVALRGVEVGLDLFGSGILVPVPAEADAAGARFHAPSSPEGEHRLVALAEGHLPVSLDLQLPLRGDDASLDLVLTEGAIVEIAVDAEGSGLHPSVLGVRVTARGHRSALLALPASGSVRLERLPPETLVFELVAPAELPRGAWLASPPLRRCGEPVVRTLAPGATNLRITLRLPKPLEPEIRCAGTTRPRAWVFRAGARRDEPGGVVRADDEGRFQVAACAGERWIAAEGELPALRPFGSTLASPTMTFESAGELEIRVLEENGKPAAGATVSVRPIGPEALGLHAEHVVADSQGRARFPDLPAGARVDVFASRAPRDAAATIDLPGPGVRSAKELRLRDAAAGP